ncbi:MAG: efflux transporter outer membrane subunit [Pigmentiphaga sp.]|uniref:efflux transporter outer membrane subunit n=1 Tax=Pigmentiphaga sp. TaxID=1977564 RepID=UPI0029AD4C63|nr:efflux transporter outer membrane subunit [Pigmentiphaga sp.]MDX3907137.1 efflux transporter outer membrane subunit [Pigmentiphaga sp.]
MTKTWPSPSGTPSTLLSLPRRVRRSAGPRLAVCACLSAMLTACAMGPDYVRPTVASGVEFKEAAGWKAAEPRDDAHRGPWWEVFGDPDLSRLMAQVETANQTIAQAEAQYRQALAVVRASRAGQFPTLSGSASATRSGTGTQSSTTTNSSGVIISQGGSQSIRNQYNLGVSASWEADLWGSIRRTVEADTASAQASAANLANAHLSAQAELARNYFQLRIMDEQQRLLDATIKVYERSLRLNENRYAVGVAAKAEIAQARTQLETTRAQAIDLRWQRAQLEHAIAILVGQPPSSFSIPSADFRAVLPAVPVGLPSELLERRPDIAAAERQVQAANARIGVTQAAYFPSLTLSASLGYRSAQFADWLTAPARFWSLGPALAAPLFDAGLRRAQTRQAEAAYDLQVATYRQTVLSALEEVENYLSQLRVMEEEQVVQQRALDAARESLRLTTNQFESGLIDYLNVVSVQTAALSNERTALSLLGNRLTASVNLIAALGGGWHADALAASGNPGSESPGPSPQPASP